LRQLSQAEHLPEDVLLRKWVLEGLDRMRLARACALYERGQLNLGGAARYAGIGVEQMMRELTQRGIDHGPSVEQFVDGLETLADLFGKDELRTAADKVRRQEEPGNSS
jgi:predicted HTH domain antitoxin